MMMMVMNLLSVTKARMRRMLTLMESLARMKMEATTMIKLRQLVKIQMLINMMEMKLVLRMDRMKQKMMRMISMWMILMEECGCRKEVL